jgi:hypothetical protein
LEAQIDELLFRCAYVLSLQLYHPVLVGAAARELALQLLRGLVQLVA